MHRDRMTQRQTPDGATSAAVHSLAMIAVCHLVAAAAAAPHGHTKCSKCHEQHQHSPPPDSEALLAGPRTVPYLASAPLGGVDVSSNEILTPTMRANADYLRTAFDVDHLLQPFRVRAGRANASSGARPQVGFWDSDLKGSNAGPSRAKPACRFLRRALLMPRVLPGHSIAAVRELKHSLWATAG